MEITTTKEETMTRQTAESILIKWSEFIRMGCDNQQATYWTAQVLNISESQIGEALYRIDGGR